MDAECRVDVFLESVELLDGLFFGRLITCYIDVYDRARGDVGGQQDGRELNLWCALVLFLSVQRQILVPIACPR